jgi:hypothetical protein
MAKDHLRKFLSDNYGGGTSVRVFGVLLLNKLMEERDVAKVSHQHTQTTTQHNANARCTER